MDSISIINLLMAKSTSHITDLIEINIKSLLPSEDYTNVYIDYKRYEEELKLWKYYRQGENKSLINILENFNPSIYWKEKDDTVYPRIMPIIIANKDYSCIKKEVIKNILFTTGDIETLIEGILLSRLFYMDLSGSENIIDKLKEEVINFSQLDFLNIYKKYYRAPIKEYEGNFKVDFERNKIFALNTLNFVHSNCFKTLEDCIKVLFQEGEPKTIMGRCLGTPKLDKVYEPSYYYNLANYVYQLSDSKIDKEALKIDKYILPDIFKLEKGQEFYHSLLKNSKVIEKKETDSEIIVHVKAKSGDYIFKKEKSLP